jgi:hypothetical protein
MLLMPPANPLVHELCNFLRKPGPGMQIRFDPGSFARGRVGHAAVNVLHTQGPQAHASQFRGYYCPLLP